jgi:predicted transcriptional regulator
MNSKDLHNFEQSLGDIEKMLPLVTQALMLYFKALVAQGFTTEQAMYLVGVHGTSFGAVNNGK